MQVKTRGELQDFISQRAASDPDYRRALIADPKRLLGQHLGQALPASLAVEVVVEKPNTLVLIAPPATEDELTDSDLEQIAGGKGGTQSNSMGDVDCYENPGAFNSIVTMNSEVSLA